MLYNISGPHHRPPETSSYHPCPGLRCR